MTPDNAQAVALIERLRRQADAEPAGMDTFYRRLFTETADALEAALRDADERVAAARLEEREVCAKIADQHQRERKIDVRHWEYVHHPHTVSEAWQYAADEAEEIAAAIRARSEGGRDVQS